MSYLNSINVKKIKILLSFLFIIAVSVSCEHCDDEDYTRDNEEQATVKHSADTLSIIKNNFKEKE